MKRKTILRLCASTFAATLLGVAPAMAQQVVRSATPALSGGAACMANVLSGMEMAIRKSTMPGWKWRARR